MGRKDGDTDADVDIFCHVKDCEGMIPLRETQKVFFTIETEDSGRLRARDVTTPGGPLRPPAPMGGPMGGPMHPHVGGPAYFPPPQQFYQPPPQQGNLPSHPAMKTPGTHVGTIKFYNGQKGFGFIITGMGTEMYLGKSSLLDQNWLPQINDTCEYTEETNGEKVWAMNVRKTDKPVTRKRPMVPQHQVSPYPVQKQARTDTYQDQYAPPQPAYNPPGQYQQPVQYQQPAYGAPAAAPPGQYAAPQYDTSQQYQQQPPAPQYDYSRPAY